MATKEYFCKVSWEKYENNELIRGHRNVVVEVDLCRYDMWEMVVFARKKACVPHLAENFTIDFMIEIPQGE